VPRGGLNGVPFHALLLDGTPFGDHREVSVLPSAGSLFVARARRVRGRGPPAVLGVPDERAPRVRDECAGLAALLPGAEVTCGPEADSARLTAAAARGARILHVATHGLFRPEVPRLSAFLLADGWFGLAGAYGLPLSADLVFLSSCDGGLGGSLRSGESLGLARALLLAGAGAFVGALGPVRDEAAATFTGAFYRALVTGASISEAHRAAVRGTRERFPHPSDSALFTVHGDGALRPLGDLP
jgi:CHAT domain-containing protein